MADKIFSIEDGLSTKLPSESSTIAGRFLVTTDTGEMYYEPGNGTRVKIGSAVEQDYNPNSEKAQSGRAVAQAIDNGAKDIMDSFNLKNGSKYGSLRGVSSSEEREGYTIGENSFANGDGTEVSGNNSFGMGYYNVVSGSNSFGMGSGNNIQGSRSQAEGGAISITGNYSQGEGFNISITGSYSQGEGCNLSVFSDHQHVQGKYNVADGKHIYADIVGNGDMVGEIEKRSNAYTLDWNGNGWFAGDVYIRSTSGINRDNGSKKLITEEHVINTFANAVKGNVSGETVVINDISPVGHNMAVRLSSDTVTDFTAVKLKRCGKNLLDKKSLSVSSANCSKNLQFTENGFSFQRTGTKSTSQVSIELFLAKGTYNIKASVVQSDGLNGGVGIYDKEKGTYILNASSRGNVNETFSIDVSKKYLIGFFCNYSSPENTTVTYSNVQLELGSAATDYEEYNGAEYTPNIDGTVEGVSSLYPNTILMTDTDGAIIDCEYNRDTEKSINNIIKSKSKLPNISEYTVTQTDFDEGKTRIEFEFPSGCKAFRLYLAVKAGTGSGNVTFQAHGKYNNTYAQKLYIALSNAIYTADRWARINAEADNGDSYYTFCGPASNNNSSAVQLNTTVIRADEPVDILYLKDGYARIWVTGSVPFPVGSKITVLWR